MSDGSADFTQSQLIDAFAHPPRLLTIGDRTESTVGEVLIVSHAELWQWRVVLRGARADKRALSYPSVVHPATVDSSVSPGTVSAALIEMSQAAKERHRAQSIWLSNWRVRDDVSTEYRLVGASSGGTGGDVWSDFHIEFEPGVPSNALVLTIVPPDGTAIVLQLHG
jgi:hypothetical protein